MPNWCWISYIAVGDKQEIHDLYNKMKSLEDAEKSLVENDFGKTWLGNLVTILGGDWNAIRCKGCFSELHIDDEGALRFEAMSAWAELSDLRQFIQSKYPSLHLYYNAEESGNCYYVTNDAEGKYFPERIKVDEQNNDPAYCKTWEEAFQVISERTGAEIHNREEMNRALEAYNEAHEDAEINIHEFTIK
jgi:hypothetical protein